MLLAALKLTCQVALLEAINIVILKGGKMLTENKLLSHNNICIDELKITFTTGDFADTISLIRYHHAFFAKVV